MEAAPAASAGTEIPDGDPVPTLTLTQEGVADGVWTFAITTDMSLTLDTAPYQPMLGHVHVYVDGVETQMIADKRFELRDLPPGTYQVSVALADTMHRDLLHNGAKISDGMEIVVPAAD